MVMASSVQAIIITYHHLMMYILQTIRLSKYGLKTGDVVECHVRPPHEGEKYFPLTSIDKINGRKPSEVRDRIPFEHLTPLFPEEKFTLCGDPRTTNLSTRIVDLFSPIGKGQRALIVAQPKTGKNNLDEGYCKCHCSQPSRGLLDDALD